MLLKKSFYERSAIEVAPDLLGCYLVRRIDGIITKTRIVETEAYEGEEDLASHASKGLTPRTSIMYGEPGHLYIYFTYGMHYMLNIVCAPKGTPKAVLIRAVEPIRIKNQSHFAEASRDKESSIMNGGANGPARLTKALQIDKTLNGLSAMTKKHGLWIESGEAIQKENIVIAARIGVDYAKDYKDKPWRFYIKDNKFVSKK